MCALLRVWTRMSVALAAIALSSAACSTDGPLLTDAPELPTTTLVVSSIGNSSPWGERLAMQESVYAVAALADGTVVALGLDDQRELVAGIYKDGRAVGQLAGVAHDGWMGGRALSVLGDVLFAALRTTDDASGPRYGVRRYAVDGTVAPWPAGRGTDGSFVLTDLTVEPIALAASPTELVVGFADGTVAGFDPITLDARRTAMAPGLRALAIDARGRLWCACGDRVRVLDTGADEAPIAEAAQPVALAAAGDRLYVGDAATGQVLVFDVARSPKRVGTMGSARAPRIDARCLSGLTSVAATESGEVVAGMNRAPAPDIEGAARPAHARIVRFDARGSPQWHADADVDVSGVGFDPGSDGRVVYTAYERYELDFFSPPGHEGRPVGWTFDGARYPADPRLRSGTLAPVVRDVAGRRLLVDRGDTGTNSVTVFRMDAATGVAILAMAILGDQPRGIERRAGFWRDDDGDGTFAESEVADVPWSYGWGSAVDDDGSIWRATESDGIWRLALTGFDAAGVPRFDVPGAQRHASPPEVPSAQRIEYVAATDTMYVAGYTVKPPGEWGLLGDLLVRYDAFTTAAAKRWSIPLLGPGLPPRARAFAVAGRRVFVGYVNDARVFVYDADTGGAVGTLSPGTHTSNVMRLPYALAAWQRHNGEYVLFEEASWWNRSLLYRIPERWGDAP